MAWHDSDEDRLRFILEGQQHCDHFLTPLADPAGKSVLVVGCGAGTEMLWCLRHGAREVVGLDVLEQSPAALAQAAERSGVDPGVPFSIAQLPVEEADRLGRRFELVLSNNVFEHLPHLAEAFAACARRVEPLRGRVAIFTDPLFYSSAGAHLPRAEPWEHLWGDAAALRQRALAEAGLPAGHPLYSLELPAYLDRELTLNRMRLGDFLAAAFAAGLVPLNLRLLPDRELGRLNRYRRRLEAAGAGQLADADFAIEGIGIELVRLEEGEEDEGAAPPAGAFRPTEQLRREAEEQARQAALHRERLERDHREAVARAEIDHLAATLRAVEQSTSFRLGRLLTAPLRALRRLAGGGR